MPMDGGVFVVSPYLSKPMRSLREVLESRAVRHPRLDGRSGGQKAVLLGEAFRPASPQAAQPSFTVVTGGLADTAD